MAYCLECNTKMPLVTVVPWEKRDGDVLCPDCTKKRHDEEQAAAAEIRSRIQVLTADHPEPYETLDSIFAIDGSTKALFQELNPQAAFEGVKQQLRVRCAELGGDAVIRCHFEYRNALADGVLGKKQSLEIFAYGTAVKLRAD